MNSSHDGTPRERGRWLLSRLNHWMIAGAVGLAGMFSFVAAETTHGKSSSSTTTTLQQPSSAPSSSSTSSSGSSSTSSDSSTPSTGVVSGGS